MCGICGIYTLEKHCGLNEPAFVRAMNDKMIHRGPDQGAIQVSGPVTLGHRRLSIIDVSNGMQPMSNEDRSVWLVFNGEIYNYRLLRRELMQKGYRFRTNSDTEVIIHLYEDIGESLFERLNGMFAIGLWDAKSQKLLLARDRLGKKPLYYHVNKRRLAFASELKALITLPDLPVRVDAASLDQYLSFLYIPAPKTVLSDVCKLEPATYLVCEHGVVRKERYWKVDFDRRYMGSHDDAVAELRDLLSDAVKIRLESEVPLGAFLSGGLDSSAVVALMARQMNRPVQTTSVGFSDEKFNELGYARLVADSLGASHGDHMLQAKFIAQLPRIVYHLDEPFADASALPTYFLCEIARQYVTVALSGDGGDENFAGYSRYPLALEQEKWRNKLPASWRALAFSLAKRLFSPLHRGYSRLENLNLDLPEAAARTFFCFTKDLKRFVYSPSFRNQLKESCADQVFLQAFPATGESLNRLQAFDLGSYLPEDILMKVDRMSMAHSLEVRTPLLDYRVVEFAASLPPAWKLGAGGGKLIFKDAVRCMLPAEVLQRSKMGFTVPLASWFRGEWRGVAEKVFFQGSFLDRGYFDPTAIKCLWDRHVNDRLWLIDLGPHLWSLLVLELWHRLFVDGETVEEVTAELLRAMEIRPVHETIV
jgi:asparagine synthase (glutamine-hydrolysing)